MRAITQFTRNFNRQTVVGLLNISSLALGVMVSVVVGLWAMGELSFDDFHAHGERMYRVVNVFDMNGRKLRAASAFEPHGEIAAARIPGIERMCRVVVDNQGLALNGKVAFGIRTLVADNNFFSFFNFPLVEGDPRAIFAGPDNVIVTESAARRWFPGQDPVGQRVVSHGYEMTIAGVMRDFPKNSHIQADFVLPNPERQAQAMALALQRARLAPEDIDLISAHATSTPEGDPKEIEAIRSVFGADCPAYVNATKGYYGHAMGAAGALELAGNLPSFEDGTVHPSINVDELDPACALPRLVVNNPVRAERPVRRILNNAFGMLGINAVTIVGKFEG